MEKQQKLLSILRRINNYEAEVDVQINRCLLSLKERNWIKLGSSAQILNHIQTYLSDLTIQASELQKQIDDEVRELL